MTLFFPFKKATLLMQSGPLHDPERLHLFILITDPVGDNKEVLMVSLSSIRDGRHDVACELNPGDHSFINKPSYVLYSHARIEPADKLLKGINEGIFIPQGTITDEVFGKICEGFDASIHVTPRIKKFILGFSK